MCYPHPNSSPLPESPWQAFHDAIARVTQGLPRDAELSDEWLQYVYPAHARFDVA
jgi:hypothetical protein